MSHIAADATPAGRDLPQAARTGGTVLAGFLRRLRQKHQARKTVALLSQLSDRELSDIGLHRGSIVDAVARLPRR